MKPAFRLALALSLTATLDAQLLYNASRDAKSQDALKTAKEVTGGQTFDKMLANVDKLAKSSSDRVFNGAEQQMRASLAAWVRFKDVRDYVSKLDARLHDDLPWDAGKSDVDAAAKDLEDEIKSAKDQLKKLTDAAKVQFQEQDDAATVGTWLNRLGQFGDLSALAAEFHEFDQAQPGFLDAAKEATTLVKSLGKMYADFRLNLPKAPDIVVLEAQIQLLEANEDHLKRLASIILRREADLADSYHLIRRVNNQFNCLTGINPPPPGTCSTPGHFPDLDQWRIVDALGEAARRIRIAPAAEKLSRQRDLGAMVFVLYNAAALAARDDAPKRLASLRMAEEEHRYSIRSSAVAARSYETLVATGAQRLAAYYKGGIKPETLAQIVNAVATLGLIPAITLK